MNKFLRLLLTAVLSTSVAIAAPCHLKQKSEQGNPIPCMKPCTECDKAEDGLSKEDAQKRFKAKMEQKREAFYDSLGLSDEQKCRARDLDSISKEKNMPLVKKVKEEKMKLNDLISKKACDSEIAEQKKALAHAKKEFKSAMEEHKKAFQAILTPEQKKKYDEIKAEKRKYYKKHKCNHCKTKMNKKNKHYKKPCLKKAS